MKMTREQQTHYLVTAKRRHAMIVARLLTVPLIRGEVLRPMAPNRRSRIIRTKASIPVAIDA
jgi:hypothetical protein